MKNTIRIYTLLLLLVLSKISSSQTTLISPTDDISDGTDYCDPIFIEASNKIVTNNFDVDFFSEATGYVKLTEGFKATVTGNNYFLASITPDCSTTVDTDEIDLLISNIQPYPNPFSSTFKFELSLNEDLEIDLAIFDETGKLVKVLLKNQHLNVGEHSLHFNGEDLPAGLYVYKIIANGHSKSGRLVCIR